MRARRTLIETLGRMIEHMAAVPADIAERWGRYQSRYESFAASPTNKAKRRVETYQNDLESAYTDWADGLATNLAAEDDEKKRDAILAAALLILLALLKRQGRDSLPDAIDIALNGGESTDEIASLLSDAIDENDGYLTDSLIPDIEEKVKAGLKDPDILAALLQGTGAAAIGGLLATVTARVGNYSGEWWDLYNKAMGTIADMNGAAVTWYLDPRAKHCEDCPQWGSTDGKTYPSYAAMLKETGDMSPANGVQCGANCRCFLEFSNP